MLSPRASSAFFRCLLCRGMLLRRGRNSLSASRACRSHASIVPKAFPQASPHAPASRQSPDSPLPAHQQQRRAPEPAYSVRWGRVARCRPCASTSARRASVTGTPTPQIDLRRRGAAAMAPTVHPLRTADVTRCPYPYSDASRLSCHACKKSFRSARLNESLSLPTYTAGTTQNETDA